MRARTAAPHGKRTTTNAEEEECGDRRRRRRQAEAGAWSKAVKCQAILIPRVTHELTWPRGRLVPHVQRKGQQGSVLLRRLLLMVCLREENFKLFSENLQEEPPVHHVTQSRKVRRVEKGILTCLLNFSAHLLSIH